MNDNTSDMTCEMKSEMMCEMTWKNDEAGSLADVARSPIDVTVGVFHCMGRPSELHPCSKSGSLISSQ